MGIQTDTRPMNQTGFETYDNLEAIKRKEEATAMASGDASIDEVECLPVVNNAEIKTEEQPQPQTRPADQCGRHNRRNINEWILTNDTIGVHQPPSSNDIRKELCPISSFPHSNELLLLEEN